MLNDSERIKKIDGEDMLGKISRIASLVESGYKLATNIDLEFSDDLKRIHFLGLGGSAIGGDVIRDWLGREIPGGVNVERGYDHSKPVEGDSLVICCSYSGNTKETISMFEEALKKDSKNLLVISSNGEIARLAERHALPMIRIEKDLPPRASLPAVVAATATVCDRIGWTKGAGSAILKSAKDSKQFVDQTLAPDLPTEGNLAKQIAHQIHGRIPVVTAPYMIESAARRWKTQLNENSKQHCFFGSFPEITHNEIIPWLRDMRSNSFASILLRADDEPPQLKEDFDRFRDTLSKSGALLIELKSRGGSRIGSILNHILISDFTSVYSAVLSGVDPTPVEDIELFKERR